MKFLLVLILVCSISVAAQNGHLIPNPIKGIPQWVRNEFSAQQFSQHYDITYQMYPQYLRGDFNGDGKTDVAIPISEKTNGKLGIAIIHGKQAQAFKHRIVILGAGKPIGAAGDDFKWMSLWNLLKDKKLLPQNERSHLPALQGAMIRILNKDGEAGVIYWGGNKYDWANLGE
jgi:hypothetical protein